MRRALTRFNDVEPPIRNYTCVSCVRHAMCRNVCAHSDVSKLEHKIPLYMFWARPATRAGLHCAPTLAPHNVSSLSYFSPSGDIGRRVNKVQFICLVLSVCDLPLANSQYELIHQLYLVLNNSQATRWLHHHVSSLNDRPQTAHPWQCTLPRPSAPAHAPMNAIQPIAQKIIITRVAAC